MDNEAGMEHISRLTTHNVNVLLLVADASRRGLQAALRINALARALHIGAEKTYLVINQAKSEPLPEAVAMIREADLEYAGTIPEDDLLYAYDSQGRPTIDLPSDSAVIRAVFGIFDRIIA
jgi:CO dehydrogenase maturation factor